MHGFLDWLLAAFILTTSAAITLWMSGALFYDMCKAASWGRWVAAGWIVVVGMLFALWQPLWQPFVVLGVVLGLFLIWWFGQQPRHDRDWETSVTVLPQATRASDAVTIENLRNFDYHSSLTDFTPRYEKRTVHLANLKSADVIFSTGVRRG